MGGILNPLYTAVSWVMITFHDLLAFTNNEDLAMVSWNYRPSYCYQNHPNSIICEAD